MKKILTVSILLFLVNTSSFSQRVYKFRSSDFSCRINRNGEWNPWTDWISSDVLIVAKDSRVNVYSSTPQTYDMIDDVNIGYDDKNNPIFSVICVDENDSRCKMIWYHTAKDGSYVLFEFSDLNLMYKVISLD